MPAPLPPPARLPLPLLALAASATALAAQRPAAVPPADTARRPLEAIRIVDRPDDLPRIPGSVFQLDSATLRATRVHTVEEALRKVPGVHTRVEDGLGLRPHIGVRGLDPLRSRKVLLLEDGLPFVLAPYGDTDSYYHPLVDRFDRIEVVKGAGQIRFGPQTIGGVINYLSRPLPTRPQVAVQLAGGAPGVSTGLLQAGAPVGPITLGVDAVRRQARLARDNSDATVHDVTLRAALTGARQSLALRLNGFDEAARAPYTGLTEAEWAANPRFNPFVNDRYTTQRLGAAATHRLRVGAAGELVTSAYGYGIFRQNWRQSGNSAQRPNDRSDPACGGMANLSTTCGNEGRVRNYHVYGVDPVLRLPIGRLGAGSELEIGGRVLYEQQQRLQLNGSTPAARTAGTGPNAGTVENNRRTALGTAAFVQPRVVLGAFTLTPGVRLERVTILRQNKLPLAGRPGGVQGDTTLTVVIPGAGVAWNGRAGLTLFAGAHRGFAPPRPEDLINNTTGGTIDLGPELSWNYEAGARGRRGAVSWEATAFRLDFENQIVPASTAGGTGAAVTNAGRTRHAGVEAALGLDRALGTTGAHRLLAQAAVTWLPIAEYAGPRFVYVGTGGSDVVDKVYVEQNAARTRRAVSVTGNRLPYAPTSLLTATVGWAHRRGIDLRIEGVFTGRQFGDPLNTSITVPDGQQGPIAAATIWNAVLNWTVAPLGATAFVSARNLTDAVYVVDRSRGLMPGMGRVVFAGVRLDR